MVCHYGMAHLLVVLPMVMVFLNSVNGNHLQNVTLRRPHQNYSSRYSADDLLMTRFDFKVSEDIDMDPCKSVGLMGDIALPNVNYDTQWQTQKLNKSFQQELERMKQEVYHEGLQVEEEGLTDIIRKKTKMPTHYDDDHHGEDVPARRTVSAASERHKNDPALLEPNQSVVTSSSSTHKLDPLSGSIPSNFNPDPLAPKQSNEVNATIINGSQQSDANRSSDTTAKIMETNQIVTSTTPVAEPKSANSSTFRHFDHSKIQSDTKDISYDSGDNIVRSRMTIATTTSPTTLVARFTQARTSAGHMDDALTLTVDTAVRKRHRRRRQGRKQIKEKRKTDDSYQSRFERLKDDLNRPIATADNVKTNRNHDLPPIRSNNFNSKHWLVNDMPVVSENGLHPSSLTSPLTMTTKMSPVERRSSSSTTEDMVVKSIRSKIAPLDNPEALPPIIQQLPIDDMQRAATAKKERIWDYGVIPYEIDANFSGAHKALFKQAMRHWENFTCIKFVERNAKEHANYIMFTIRPCGCCSFVGKRGNGGQAISIGKNCDKFGIVVHELGHVVGFWHEHTRPDRESHVVIERGNIMMGQEYNFNKLTSEDVNSLGLAYDYDSIMHYARNTFSKGTFLDTIHPVDPPETSKKRPEIGQRLKLSEGDIAQANLLYKCPKCGRTFQDNSASFASPSYYSKVASIEPEACEWRITATHGEQIVLNITDLDIFKSNNCRTDYLEIKDGYWHKSPVLGRYCGSGKIPELIKSTGSRMLVTLTTSMRQQGYRGFAANYEAVCGGELNIGSGGRLESPNYPLDYLPNKECIWRITVEKEYQVALKFQSFEVENHDNCVYDYVEVRDGDSPNSRLIGVFCGYKVPPDMRSTTNKMFVKFVSDSSVQKAGFSATFIKELDECELQDHGCEHECINTLGGYQCSCYIGYELHSDKKTCENACGGVIDTLNGTITSPSFPDFYPMSKECVWEISVPAQYRIHINFTHFDLEGNAYFAQECDYDSLTVYSMIDEDNLKRHGIFCGSRQLDLITSEGNAMRIEFKSDNTIQKTGFAAVFFTDIDECSVNNGGCMHECKNTIGSYICSCHNGYILHENGHECKEGGCKYEITAPHGQIYSPNYPDYYPPNKDCVWHFSTTPGHRIRLTFTVFEMEPHQECAYDHIAIYNGDSPESFTLGRFCGSKLPHPISTSSNEMFMVFKSDMSVQRGGFAATHSTSCGGRLTATSRVQHIYSHAKFGDYDYDNNAACDWTIEATSNRNIQITFLTFDIEDEKSCSYDFVEVFSGPDDYIGPLFGRYCGSTKPPDIISIYDALLVRFRSDSTMVLKGFSVSYVAVDPFESSGEMNSDSSEMVTPFPGSLRGIYTVDQFDDDYNEYDSYNRVKYKQSELPDNRLSAEQFD